MKRPPATLLRLIAAAVVLGVAVGSAPTVLLGAPLLNDPEPVAELDQKANIGRGELMLLVVSSDFATRVEAEAFAGSLSFGDLQGFYVDSTNNYDLVGAYEQTSPDVRIVACGADADVICPQGITSTKAFDPVRLEYRPVGALNGLLTAPDAIGCDGMDRPPCVRKRLARLIARDVLKQDRWILLSAFRTKQGAEEFVDLARAAGAPALAVIRVQKVEGPYVGLGQEAHPDGVSGPLMEALPDPAKYQE